MLQHNRLQLDASLGSKLFRTRLFHRMIQMQTQQTSERKDIAIVLPAEGLYVDAFLSFFADRAARRRGLGRSTEKALMC